MSTNGNAESALPWPIEIKLKREENVLVLQFEGGENFNYPAEFLRVESPSAEVQGHAADEKKTIGGKRNVAITGLEPVGNYAVRIDFNDGHDTGLYTWEYLYDLGQNQDAIWEAYLKALDAKGLSRDG